MEVRILTFTTNSCTVNGNNYDYYTNSEQIDLQTNNIIFGNLKFYKIIKMCREQKNAERRTNL